MASRNRGFDPLSSLFEAPDPTLGAPSPPPESDPGTQTPAGGVELTDPTFKAPPDIPAPSASPAEPPPLVEAPPAARPEPPVDKVAIARAVAQAAQARMKEEELEAGPTEEAPRPEPPSKPLSRLDRLSARAIRPRSALDAARAAAAAEKVEREAQVKAAKAERARGLVHDVAGLISTSLPGLGRVEVVNALQADERVVLTALWRAHRAKFLSDGQLERAVAAAAVLGALEGLGQGNLVVAHVVTAASDYLVWLDVERPSLVAAFSDAKAYFAAGGS